MRGSKSSVQVLYPECIATLAMFGLFQSGSFAKLRSTCVSTLCERQPGMKQLVSTWKGDVSQEMFNNACITYLVQMGKEVTLENLASLRVELFLTLNPITQFTKEKEVINFFEEVFPNTKVKALLKRARISGTKKRGWDHITVREDDFEAYIDSDDRYVENEVLDRVLGLAQVIGFAAPEESEALYYFEWMFRFGAKKRYILWALDLIRKHSKLTLATHGCWSSIKRAVELVEFD